MNMKSIKLFVLLFVPILTQPLSQAQVGGAIDDWAYIGESYPWTYLAKEASWAYHFVTEEGVHYLYVLNSDKFMAIGEQQGNAPDSIVGADFNIGLSNDGGGLRLSNIKENGTLNVSFRGTSFESAAYWYREVSNDYGIITLAASHEIIDLNNPINSIYDVLVSVFVLDFSSSDTGDCVGVYSEFQTNISEVLAIPTDFEDCVEAMEGNTSGGLINNGSIDLLCAYQTMYLNTTDFAAEEVTGTFTYSASE